MSNRIRILFVSNLFPSKYEPVRGVFNFHQMRHLARLCEVQVVAPFDWFFIKGRFAPPQPLPLQEEVGGLKVYHPRNFYLPKIGRTLNPLFYALSTRGLIAKIRRDFPFEVIFVNWAYPDACGIAKVARWLRVPLVVSISGSDANVYLNYRIRRRQILQMLAQAKAITVRSRALKELLLSHRVPAEKIHVLYNGVDRELFQPRLKTQNLKPKSSPALLYVGRLSPEKGVADLLRAVGLLRDKHNINARLVIVGNGHQRDSLKGLARDIKLESSVDWIGWKNPEEIAALMGAADLLCLPSHMEGVPNAALEAFACGLPVVATHVGGIPEIVTEETGILAPPHNPPAFAQALSNALNRQWNPAAIRAHSQKFDWNENAERLYKILSAAIG